MEMDYNLKKLSNFFQVLQVYFSEIAENRFIVCSSLKKSVDIFSRCSTNNFMSEKKFYVKCLSSFGQNTAKSPSQCSFNGIGEYFTLWLSD